jgi:hypothetical protein
MTFKDALAIACLWWVKVKNPNAPAATRAIRRDFLKTQSMSLLGVKRTSLFALQMSA